MIGVPICPCPSAALRGPAFRLRPLLHSIRTSLVRERVCPVHHALLPKPCAVKTAGRLPGPRTSVIVAVAGEHPRWRGSLSPHLAYLDFYTDTYGEVASLSMTNFDFSANAARRVVVIP